jgi:hypothetical protein
MAEAKGVARFLRQLKGQRQGSNPTGAFATKLEQPSETNSTFASDEAFDKATEVTEESLEQFYMPIEGYEGRHRYDPKARWTEAEEKALIRRVGVQSHLVSC